MTILVICVAGIIVLMLFRVPVAFAFGAGGLVMVLLYDLDVGWIMPSTFALFTSFPLLAIPLFVFLGLLMEYSGAVRRLVDFVNALVGRVRGGIGAVTVVANGMFGAISGSAAAALVTFSTIMFPRLKEEGYHEGFAVALIASSAMLSLFIPPSMDMIMFGFVAQISISACFLATVGPGLLLMILFSIINFIVVRKFNLRTYPKQSFAQTARDARHHGKRAFFILLIPVVILGGIYGGIFTPTEAAAAGVAATLIVTGLIYRSLTRQGLSTAMMRSVALTGMIMAILFFMFVTARVMLWQNLIQAMIAFFVTVSENLMVQLLMMNALLILLGMIIDDNSAAILSGILLLPVMVKLGVNPYHFAGIVMSNLGLGLVTPPVAPMLYAAAGVTGVPLKRFFKYSLYFMIFANLPVIFLATYIPEVCTFLPNLVFGTGLGKF